MNKLLKTIGLVSVISLFTGCAAIGTAVSHGSLQTQTLMSDSIFLSTSANQVPPTIYIMITNSTDHPNFTIEGQLINKLRNKGYRIVDRSDEASYTLQVNILQVGKNSQTAAKEMMGNGYGGALEGIASGVAISAATGGGLVIGGIAGGVAGSVADNLVKDVTYSVITDVKLTQRFQKIPGNLKPIVNKTRILSTADRVNLGFKVAEGQLETGLSDSLSGLFILRTDQLTHTQHNET